MAELAKCEAPAEPNESQVSEREKRIRSSGCCLAIPLFCLLCLLIFCLSVRIREAQVATENERSSQTRGAKHDVDDWLLFSSDSNSSKLQDDEWDSLLGQDETSVSSKKAENSSNSMESFKTNEDSNLQLNQKEEKRNSSSRLSKRLSRSRRVALLAERRPILNEFSFPANLVQGMRFVLMCQVLDGEPPVRIRWFKDQVDLSEQLAAASNRMSQQQQQQGIGDSPDQQLELLANDELGSSLLFRRVQQAHSGNYTCLATNHHGTSSYSSIMTVKVPPKWRVEPQDQESIIGEQITIDCQATGNPNPFIRWKFTSSSIGSQVLNSAGAEFRSSGVASDDLMSIAGNNQVALQNSNSQQQQQFAFKLINSNHHVQTLENGSLSIRSSAKEHGGYYLCEADNGVEPSLVKILRLTVHQQAQLPEDIQLLEPIAGGGQVMAAHHQQPPATSGGSIGLAASAAGPQNGAIGQQNALIKSLRVAQNTTLVRLLCQPIGELPLTLDWLRDGQLIYTHSMQPPGDLSSGRQSASLTSSASASSSSSSSSSAMIAATAAATTSATPFARYRVSTRRSPTRPLAGADSELAISSVSRHDAALYTCSARNSFGRAERTVRLVVQEPPEPPEMVDVAHISSRSIGLRWSAPFDGNSPIVKYIVEYRKHPIDQLDNNNGSGGGGGGQQTFAALTGRSEKMMPFKSLDQSGQPSASASSSLAANSVLATSGQQQQVQHTIHDLEPLAHYTMRVLAVNSIGHSRPSVALSLRTEEEVPSVVPNLVEANVLSSKSIKLRWTITYAPEREIIDGFFVGYRSLEAQTLDGLKPQVEGSSSGQQNPMEQPTFTYKTIRLSATNNQAASRGAGHKNNGSGGLVLDNHLATQDHQSALLSPVSTVSKAVPASGSSNFNLALIGHSAAQPMAPNQVAQQVVVVSTFEYVITGLERNTEYTILIQCFNKKGAGPTSDPIVFKTFAIDPPDKLLLAADDITESSLRLSWRFVDASLAGLAGKLTGTPEPPVDGYVLTFARVSTLAQQQQQQQPKSRPVSPISSAQLAKSPYLTEQSATMDSPAARISQANPIIPTSANENPSHNLMDQWQAIQLAPQQRSHQLKNLECGSSYAMKIWAFNKVGRGEPSELLNVKTRGKAPIAPDKRSFLSINSTQVKLHLVAWYDGGCEIEKFVVQYRARGQQEWILVSNNILKEQLSIVIRDLLPATSYELLVAAQNHVGTTDMRYRFYTLDSEGKQVSLGHSMFDSSDMDDLDYSDPQNPTARREPWPSAGGGGQESSFRTSMVLLRHLLNSPFSLLLALSLFVILFIMLVFHRYTLNTGSTTSLGTLNSSSNKSSRNGNHSNGHGRRDSDGGGGGGQMNVTMTGDGSDVPLSGGSLNDTPQRLVPDSHHQRSNYGANYAASTATGGLGAESLGAPECQSPFVGSAACQAANLYGQLGAGGQYASVHRNLGDVSSEQQQQCLMQMFMLNAQQQQQQQNHLTESEHHQSPLGPDGGPLSSSYVTAALTTLARNKSRLQNQAGPMSYSGYASGPMNAATLGRLQYSSSNFPEQSASGNGNGMLEMREVGGNSSGLSRSSSRYWRESNNNGHSLSTFGFTTTNTNSNTNGVQLSDVASTSGRGTCSSSLIIDSETLDATIAQQPNNPTQRSVADDNTIGQVGNCDNLNVKQYEVPFARSSLAKGAVGNEAHASGGEKDDVKTLICY